ncbi:hypothetical protein NDN08_004577 [Rhodosorus marinus]|uniref:Uncharacterized protein n=1 Tax=Rhodosorus marinus TaxID=101924 RepID=A0AAV8ULM3_9RHOD|nr:hypothetical protein NDN08_004577 [Rhodosorus marinus]
MKAFAIGFLLLFAAACGVNVDLEMVRQCPVGENGELTEEMRLAITRPLCEAECMPVDMAVNEIVSAINKAKLCYRSKLEDNFECFQQYGLECDALGFIPNSNEQLDDQVTTFANGLVEGTLYEGTCRATFNDENRLCVFSRVAMLLVNKVMSLCSDVDGSEQAVPADDGSVLSCSPLHTLPISHSDMFESPLDAASAEAPFDDPQWIVTLGTDDEKMALRAFYIEHIDELNGLLEEMNAESNEFGAEAVDLRGWAENAPEFREKLTAKFDELKRQRDQIDDIINELNQRTYETEANLAALDEQNTHLNQDSRKMKLAIRAEKRRRFKLSQAVMRADRLRCRDAEVCVDHVWHSNVWILPNCRSICTSYICSDRLTLKYCIAQTLAWGNTKPICHANAWSRSYCYEGY